MPTVLNNVEAELVFELHQVRARAVANAGLPVKEVVPRGGVSPEQLHVADGRWRRDDVRRDLRGIVCERSIKDSELQKADKRRCGKLQGWGLTTGAIETCARTGGMVGGSPLLKCSGSGPRRMPFPSSTPPVNVVVAGACRPRASSASPAQCVGCDAYTAGALADTRLPSRHLGRGGGGRCAATPVTSLTDSGLLAELRPHRADDAAPRPRLLADLRDKKVVKEREGMRQSVAGSL